MQRVLAMFTMFGIALCGCVSSTGGMAARAVDGSWTATFNGDRDAIYHAAVDTFLSKSYSLQKTNGPGGTFTARSPVQTRRIPLLPDRVRYTIAHVVVEPATEGMARVRLTLTKANESASNGREPNNDDVVEDREAYEIWFGRIGARVNP